MGSMEYEDYRRPSDKLEAPELSEEAKDRILENISEQIARERDPDLDEIALGELLPEPTYPDVVGEDFPAGK